MKRLKLYIDKENIQSFMNAYDKKNNDFGDCIKMLRRYVDIHYNFSREEIREDKLLKAWFLNLTGQDVGNKYGFDDEDEDDYI